VRMWRWGGAELPPSHPSLNPAPHRPPHPGEIYELVDFRTATMQAVPRFQVRDGSSDAKPTKTEWLAVKDGCLCVGFTLPTWPPYLSTVFQPHAPQA
jgi:hypothetical protein